MLYTKWIGSGDVNEDNNKDEICEACNENDVDDNVEDEKEVVEYEVLNIYTGLKRFKIPYKGEHILFNIKSTRQLLQFLRTACAICKRSENQLHLHDFFMRFYLKGGVCPLIVTIDDFLDFGEDGFIELDGKIYGLKHVYKV